MQTLKDIGKLVLLVIILGACGCAFKYTMKNCEHINDNFYQCEKP